MWPLFDQFISKNCENCVDLQDIFRLEFSSPADAPRRLQAVQCNTRNKSSFACVERSVCVRRGRGNLVRIYGTVSISPTGTGSLERPRTCIAAGGTAGAGW